MNDTPIDANGLLVVVCTFNEIGNLPRLVDELRRSLPGSHILVVDDSSPDGTGRWAELQAENLEDLFCLMRHDEKGLGSAAIAGLSWGLRREYRWLATMDADFSHDPTQMPKLLAAIMGDVQPGLVVGSRYVLGGGISGWPMHRRLASKLLNGVTRMLLRIPVRDCTGAMRIYRSDVLERVNVSGVRATGYGYLEELLFRISKSGAKIVEVPIHFQDRTEGKSKASWRHGLAALGRIAMIRFGR